MLHYLSFSRKLTVGFAILLMVSTFGAFFIYSFGKESNLKVAQVFEVWLPALTNENEVFRNVSEARRLEFEFAAAKDSTLRAKVKEELESKVNNLFIYQKTLRASLIDKDDNELMDQFSDTWDQYKTIHESAVALVTSGKNDQAITLLSQQGTVTYEKAAEILDKLGISLYKKGLQANQNVIESAKKLERMNIAIAIIVAIFGAGLAFFVNKTTSKALNRIAVVLVKCANHIEEKLNHLSETSGNLEKASMSSASAIQETAAALDEISAMTNKNSAGAKKTSDLSKLSSDLLRQSETAMKSVVENISEVDQSLKQIIDAANKNNVDLSEIQTLMENIKAKAGVINDIVFQTKLLSFNASIEAARAGEQGKGFSVVAQEIGNLAQMSGSAAGEISTILDSGNSAVSTIVLSTKQRVDLLTRQSSEKIQGGHDATEDAEMRIAEAVRKGIDVSQLIDEIATACRDQAKGIEEVVKSMNEMDRLTQENSHSATEVSRAVIETNAVVDEMRTAVLELEKFLKGNKNISS